MNTLEVTSIFAGHGQLKAVHDVSFAVNSGKMVFITGANGAGKTTLLRSIAGDHKAESGRVLLSGIDLSELSAHYRARSGLSLVPEGRRLFPNMTVRENLLLGNSTGRDGAWTIEAIYDAFPNLVKLDSSPAGKLSGGEQQAVAIGRALMGGPDAIMLDEVSLGLSPAAVDLAYHALNKVREMGLAIVVVEQDLSRALKYADDIIVMCEGRVTLHAKSENITLEQMASASFGHGEEK